MSRTIDISGLDKARVLATLFNASKQQGAGFLQVEGEFQMTVDEAKVCLEGNHRKYFDYLRGRIMKISLKTDELNPTLYDRDNGLGSCEAALSSLLSIKSREENPNG